MTIDPPHWRFDSQLSLDIGNKPDERILIFNAHGTLLNSKDKKIRIGKTELKHPIGEPKPFADGSHLLPPDNGGRDGMRSMLVLQCKLPIGAEDLNALPHYPKVLVINMACHGRWEPSLALKCSTVAAQVGVTATLPATAASTTGREACRHILKEIKQVDFIDIRSVLPRHSTAARAARARYVRARVRCGAQVSLGDR